MGIWNPCDGKVERPMTRHVRRPKSDYCVTVSAAFSIHDAGAGCAYNPYLAHLVRACASEQDTVQSSVFRLFTNLLSTRCSLQYVLRQAARPPCLTLSLLCEYHDTN